MSRWLWYLSLVICWVSPAVALETLADRQQPLEVTSTTLEADNQAGTAVFSGDVVARQGDVTIYAGRMTIQYDNQAREVRRIVAEQDVRIVQGERLATAQRAEYDQASGEIVLTGEPRVHQGKNEVSGEKITVFIDQDKSIVTGNGNSRVNAVFHPGEKQP